MSPTTNLFKPAHPFLFHFAPALKEILEEIIIRMSFMANTGLNLACHTGFRFSLKTLCSIAHKS